MEAVGDELLGRLNGLLNPVDLAVRGKRSFRGSIAEDACHRNQQGRQEFPDGSGFHAVTVPVTTWFPSAAEYCVSTPMKHESIARISAGETDSAPTGTLMTASAIPTSGG